MRDPSKVIDPTLTLADLAKRGLSASGVPLPSNNSTTMPSVSADTRAIAQTIDPDVPFAELMAAQQSKASCKTVFYGYKPPQC